MTKKQNVNVYVDLDETLVATYTTIPEVGVFEYEKFDILIHSGHAYNSTFEEYVAYKRPSVEYFLQKLRELSDHVIMITSASFDYAYEVNACLDLGFDPKSEIISREMHIGNKLLGKRVVPKNTHLNYLIDNLEAGSDSSKKKMSFLGEDFTYYIQIDEFKPHENTEIEDVNRMMFNKIVSEIEFNPAVNPL